MKKNYLNTKTMAQIAILSAISFLVMLLEIPVPFAPAFYKIDFSEVIVLVAAFSIGPLAGILIEGFKILLNLLFTGTTTMFVGELANFLIGASFILVSVMIYQRGKNLKFAMLGLVSGTLVMSIVGTMANYYILLPFYIKIMNFPQNAIIDLAKMANPAIDSLFKLCLLAVFPFNLLKGILDSIFVVLLYNRMSKILD